jgi:hypothetical protein
MSGKTVQIPMEVEKFFREAARKKGRAGIGRSRMLAFTYEFVNNDFERCFERVLKMPVHVDIVASHKDEAVRTTNRYNLWYANWRGTFHPKLICLMSGGEVIAGLGSSNLTSSGLQENLETWAFSREVEFLSGVRDFLRDIAKKNIVSARVGIDEFLAVLPQRQKKAVFSTLDGSLIGQVISCLHGSVKKLDIISPIHGDPTLVIGKLKSKIKSMKICLYAGDAAIPKIKGIADYKCLKRPEASDGQARSAGLLHAKLYAFHSGQSVHLFWGSANLSTSAWLRADRGSNVELLAHSLVDRKYWSGFIKSPLPGHKWVEIKPEGGSIKKEERPTGLGWRLLNAVWENKKLHLIASSDISTNLQLRKLGTKAITTCQVIFKDREGSISHNVATALGFTEDECPSSLKWRRKSSRAWRDIPVNNLDIAPDGTKFKTLTERLYWEFACRPLPKKANMQIGGDNHKTEEALLPEEEELAISEHQGDLDCFVLEWRSIVKKMHTAAHGNKKLLNQYAKKIKKELDKVVKEEPDKWPQFKIQFVNELLSEKWEN